METCCYCGQEIHTPILSIVHELAGLACCRACFERRAAEEERNQSAKKDPNRARRRNDDDNQNP